MNQKIAPKEILNIKRKGVDINAFQEVRKSWTQGIKEIVLKPHDKSNTNH